VEQHSLFPASLHLTAFHVIGDRILGKARDGPFQLRFLEGYTCEAKYDDGDGRLDFALLSLQPPLREDFEPTHLNGRGTGDRWFCQSGLSST
jgi:hypothetical protein